MDTKMKLLSIDKHMVYRFMSPSKRELPLIKETRLVPSGETIFTLEEFDLVTRMKDPETHILAKAIFNGSELKKVTRVLGEDIEYKKDNEPNWKIKFEQRQKDFEEVFKALKDLELDWRRQGGSKSASSKVFNSCASELSAVSRKYEC